MNKIMTILLMMSCLLAGCADVNPSSGTSVDSPAANALDSPGGQQLPIDAHLYVGDRPDPILLEVARTSQQQAMGLMFREPDSLPDGHGMLFPFEPPRPVQFWMMNVKFNLDMIFVHQGEVSAIAANVPPCRVEPCPVYGPKTPVDGVVELTGGQAEVLNIQVGDPINIEFLEEDHQPGQ